MRSAIASVLALGFGSGLAVGVGTRTFVIGAVLVVLAVVATAVTVPPLRSSPAPAPADASVPGGPPTLEGLGTRVEQILRLAEEQAGDRLREAERDAELIRAAAHRQARGVAGPTWQATGSASAGTADPQRPVS